MADAIKLKGGRWAEDPRLDRVPQWDERNRDYPITAVIEDRPVRSRGWSLKVQLDQGNEGACVGFGWSHELAAVPAKVKGITDAYAHEIYKQAQKVDQWPGENYEGTSVLAGAKVCKARGHISEYRWAFSLEDVLLALSYAGPVVIGVDWYQGMFRPDAKGYIYPTGRVQGGHCVVLIGVHTSTRRVVGQNSWGLDWGKNGRFYLEWDHLGYLLDRQGDACIPMGRA
jgi:hypothetical protein